MLDYDHLRIRALELARRGWISPSQLARELGINYEDAKGLLDDLEHKREGWA